MTTIYIVRKHPVITSAYRFRGTLKAFTIHSTHATRAEAAAVAKKLNVKAQSYEYHIGKVVLK